MVLNIYILLKLPLNKKNMTIKMLHKDYKQKSYYKIACYHKA